SGQRAREGVAAETEQEHADRSTKRRFTHPPKRESAQKRSDDSAGGERADEQPVRDELGSLGREIHRYARSIDDERDRGGRGDERFSLDVESEKRSCPDAALISDEAAQKSRERTSDQRGTASREPHALRKSGNAPQAREQEEQTEHDGEGRALDDGLKGRTDEPADRARRAEAQQDLAIDVCADEEESDERAGEVGKRDHRDRQPDIELDREDRREHA